MVKNSRSTGESLRFDLYIRCRSRNSEPFAAASSHLFIDGWIWSIAANAQSGSIVAWNEPCLAPSSVKQFHPPSTSCSEMSQSIALTTLSSWPHPNFARDRIMFPVEQTWGLIPSDPLGRNAKPPVSRCARVSSVLRSSRFVRQIRLDLCQRALLIARHKTSIWECSKILDSPNRSHPSVLQGLLQPIPPFRSVLDYL